ncbi:probable RNA-binding protein 19 [Anopheles marshallii]|uniref:probable RNA-binding protein 19 n=1 Tax=Anopheles marshallii TaxID=1521116 RepID=UPI00237B571A|nr:probable RNA-binding protein 19 [Anopheles marshallii]
MSRIIIKNIPNGFDEAKLRNHFSTCGIITDVQLKYTPEGKFRNFGFIGFENEEHAEKAIKHFNNSFIRTSKITVAPCVALSESKTLKVWSKHAQKPAEPVVEKSKKVVKEKVKPQTAKDVLSKYQDDPQFHEFLDAHKRAGKSIWDNQFQQKDAETKEKASDAKPASEDSACEVEPSDETKSGDKKAPKKPIALFVAKVHNIPASTKRQDLIRFFKTAKPYSVRIPPKQNGFAYVGFKTESELAKALLMDKSFLGGKQVKIFDFSARSAQHASEANGQPKQGKQAKWDRQKANASTEAICESGKMFFRNLAYSVQEDDIRTLFEKYGPVAEVDVPIDSNTRKIRGFGTVTFMIPEHAITAFNELNGTFLQGRMFHILPARVSSGEKAAKDEEDNTDDYRKKKEQTLKKTAQSSHNWNTLFMGENAVAEAVAKKYGTTKEQILVSSEGDTSAAVRLALGETELVLEMQSFLQEHGISLDAFSSNETKRSNTVILVKNLAPGCTKEALRKLFAPHGLLGRVVLPPSAVTAVIEYLDPSEARKAFKKLAYSMFLSLPLYLEWAPINTFTSAPPAPSEEASIDTKSSVPAGSEKEDVDDTEPEDGTTLFLRNLSFTTNEDAIRERFRNVGTIHSVQVARTKDLSGSGQNESRGYGFIQFKRRQTAEYALKNLQSIELDGRKVELVRSDRTLRTAENGNDRKKSKAPKQTGSKILVRNIPFQASEKEVRDLFKPFGDIKSLRLPKKMAASAEESHRGFCFVEFVEAADAKRAFDTLGRSTHLYGRRLVLEWAAPDNDVEELRKRTAVQFSSDNAGAGGKRMATGKAVLSTEEFINAKSANDDEDDDGYENGF